MGLALNPDFNHKQIYSAIVVDLPAEGLLIFGYWEIVVCGKNYEMIESSIRRDWIS
jgi:hypothetical protein